MNSSPVVVMTEKRNLFLARADDTIEKLSPSTPKKCIQKCKNCSIKYWNEVSKLEEFCSKGFDFNLIFMSVVLSLLL
jgi:hypothetical protein